MLSNVHSQKTQTAQCFPRGCGEDRVCRHVRSDVWKIARMPKSYQTCREDIYNDNAPGAAPFEMFYPNLQRARRGCFGVDLLHIEIIEIYNGGYFCGLGFCFHFCASPGTHDPNLRSRRNVCRCLCG